MFGHDRKPGLGCISVDGEWMIVRHGYGFNIRLRRDGGVLIDILENVQDSRNVAGTIGLDRAAVQSIMAFLEGSSPARGPADVERLISEALPKR